MHEMAIANEILRLVKKTASEAGGRKVKKISLRVGAFAGVMIDALRFGLETISAGTIAADAVIEIENVALMIRCQKCVRQSEIEPYYFICPHCQSTEVEIIAGEELELVSLEIDGQD